MLSMDYEILKTLEDKKGNKIIVVYDDYQDAYFYLTKTDIKALLKYVNKMEVTNEQG